MTNLQPWLVLTGPGTALVLFLVKMAFDRRAAARGPREQGAREAALTISQLVDETQQELAGAGVLGTHAKFSELVDRWKSTTQRVRRQLSPELAGRVDAFNELLASAQRLGLHRRASDWPQAVAVATRDITSRATAELQARRPPPRIFPDTEELRELLDKGQRLGTGVGELNRRIWSGLCDIDRHIHRQTTRRQVAFAFVFGAAMGAYTLALVIWGPLSVL